MESAPEHKNTEKKQRRRFQPGESGNPKGRPRGSRNKISKDIKVHISECLPAIVDALVEKAARGHVQAATALLRTIVPQAREEVEPILLKLPKIETAGDAAKAIAAVLEAVSAGKIAPDVAERIVTMIERHARVLEATDLERRIAALETSHKPNENAE